MLKNKDFTTDDGLDDEIELLSYKAKKVRNNSNTHKNRLKELEENQDFN